MVKRIVSGGAKALVLCLGLNAGAAFADDLFDFLPSTNESGILSMETVLAQTRANFPGTITEIELERKRGAWVYEVDVVEASGRKTELLIDARTGAVLSKKVERN